MGQGCSGIGADMSNILRGPPLEAELPRITCGRRMFDALQNLPPDKVMLIEADTGHTVTSEEMLVCGKKLAVGLGKMGVCPGDAVSIIAENTTPAAIAGVATLFMGAIMAPIDPLLKSLEFQHILKILSPKVVIADDNIVDQITDALDKLGCSDQVSIITLQPLEGYKSTEDVLSATEDAECDEFEPWDGSEDEIAVIVCSSGTTGLPKGVAISHYAFAYQYIVFEDLWPSGFCLHTSYFYWISGVLFLLGTTVKGVARVLVKVAEPVAALTAIHNYKPTFGLMAPAFLSSILHHPDVHDFDLTSLQTLTAGGSALTKTLIDKVKTEMPGCKLVQGYGASEVAGLLTISAPPQDPLSVGKVVAESQVKVVDRTTGELLSADCDGEILCKSPSKMVGYFGNPAATAEAIDEEGWYHTGDIGRFTSEGLLYITGRAKELIKVGGHQISPEELEEVIAGVEGVVDVVVTGITVGDDQLPMALVVTKQDSQVTEQDILDVIRDNLSDFKQLRGGVSFVDHFPRTSTGKIKRRAVQALAEELYQSKL